MTNEPAPNFNWDLPADPKARAEAIARAERYNREMDVAEHNAQVERDEGPR